MKKKITVIKRRRDGVKQRYHVTANVRKRSRVGITPEDLYPESGLSISEQEKVRERISAGDYDYLVPRAKVMRSRPRSKPKDSRVKKATRVAKSYIDHISEEAAPLQRYNSTVRKDEMSRWADDIIRKNQMMIDNRLKKAESEEKKRRKYNKLWGVEPTYPPIKEE